jgi:SAM-dependent methyltransferase
MNLFKRLKKFVLYNVSPAGFYFKHPGFCPCCDQKVNFISVRSWLRDSFHCSNCHSIPRERALMYVVEKYYPDWKNIIIHESSPEERGASIKLKKYNKNYKASQYFPDKPSGIIIGDFQNENLEELTLEDNSIDLFITQDVMEHVYNPSKAFSEIGRVLKKGGAHIFTVPLVNKHKPSEIWALQGPDNRPSFLKSPEFHGNPVDVNGSPVTMHWGFDIVDFIKRVSDLETTIDHLDDLDLGIRAEYIEVLISKKV